MKKIVLVDNGGIVIQGNNLKIHSSNKQFFEELLAYFDKLIMPQFLHSSENCLMDWNISDVPNIIVKGLNFSHSHKGLLHKILNYIAASFKLIPLVRSNSFFYIYFPGALPTIVIVLCLLFRKDYALYVRGDWLTRRHWITENFYGLLFSKACFLLVTGKNYQDKIKPWNKNTEKVIPMIKVIGEDIYHRCSYAFTNRVNLLFLSRVEKAKGIFEVLEAFERLLKKDRRLHLTIVGDGPDFVQLETLCKTKGIMESVSLLGLIKDQEEIRGIYKRADIFIFPSYTEGFPRVLYEAMTFGLPIITTFVGGISSVMEDGLNCLRVEKENTVDLEEKIRKLLGDEELRGKIGKNATETMGRLFEEIQTNSHAKQLLEWMERTGVKLS